MKAFTSIALLLLIISLALISCDPATEASTSDGQTTVNMPEREEGPTDGNGSVSFDSLAAKRYGADNYGMKKYVMAFLKKGPNRELEQAKANELQMAHMKNIERMAKEGKLVLAGPFFGNGEIRGIYIFNVESIAQAEALTNSDPAIQAGSLVMELKEWYGSAALMMVNEVHNTLAKKTITEE